MSSRYTADLRLWRPTKLIAAVSLLCRPRADEREAAAPAWEQQQTSSSGVIFPPPQQPGQRKAQPPGELQPLHLMRSCFDACGRILCVPCSEPKTRAHARVQSLRVRCHGEAQPESSVELCSAWASCSSGMWFSAVQVEEASCCVSLSLQPLRTTFVGPRGPHTGASSLHLDRPPARPCCVMERGEE